MVVVIVSLRQQLSLTTEKLPAGEKSNFNVNDTQTS
jgi:hypothetical protein